MSKIGAAAETGVAKRFVTCLFLGQFIVAIKNSLSHYFMYKNSLSLFFRNDLFIATINCTRNQALKKYFYFLNVIKLIIYIYFLSSLCDGAFS